MSRWVNADWLYNELGNTNMDIYTNEVKEYTDPRRPLTLLDVASASTMVRLIRIVHLGGKMESGTCRGHVISAHMEKERKNNEIHSYNKLFKSYR